ncbi:uncharacterized protein EDB91DRAFT_1083629 [Suillus paluster]|uniref:uncharacterized protein n=1 Tax=Suillus paluster TaxID=48578 RepID=UPI001B85CDFB|nr:uncharacterized protein EDB91DRAFT_1083629 [Suillus paluster]KAG1735724.1 hypothetical protein EDB91DRAFT_1083629 [Suillus paluster]
MGVRYVAGNEFHQPRYLRYTDLSILKFLHTRPTVVAHNLPYKTPLPIEESSSGLLSSAFEAGVISLLTTGFDMLREPLPTADSGESVPIIERCRQQLAPVLLMSAKSQDSSTTLDIKQCAAMLTDNHCREFLQQARDMKLQMDALAPHLPDVAADAHINKEDVERSMEEHDESTRNTRVRLDSADGTLYAASRKDSEATRVDLPIDHKASTPAQDFNQNIVMDFTPPVKQNMENDEASSPHNRNSADVQTSSAPPHQMNASSSNTVEDIEMTTSPTCHSANSVPSPADAQNLATCSSADSHTSSPSLNMSTLSMPGTWFRRQGLTRPGILNVDFMVGDRIIPASSSNSAPNPPLVVKLSCFRKDPHHELQEDDSFETTLVKVRNTAEDWPTKGFLVVQLNVESANGRSWLPYDLLLLQEKGALNVTSSITPGNNTMRLIHLGDLSDFTFVLYALPAEPPKREEPWRRRCWASKVRPATEIPSNNTIHKYANLPVTAS